MGKAATLWCKERNYCPSNILSQGSFFKTVKEPMHVIIMPLHLQIIMSKPAGGPKPKDNPNWDED